MRKPQTVRSANRPSLIGRILLAESVIPAFHCRVSPTWKALITMSLG